MRRTSRREQPGSPPRARQSAPWRWIGLAALATGLVWVGGGTGSIYLAADTARPTLQVDAHGTALVTYRSQGRTVNVTLSPSGMLSRGGSLAGHDVSRPTAAGSVPLALAVRHTGDGTTYALQAWQVAGQPVELHLARWRGEATRITLAADARNVTGTAVFHGRPATGSTVTLDGRPRTIFVYLDCYGCGGRTGWTRMLGIRPRPDGSFTVALRPDWVGTRYRATVAGPNVGGMFAPDARAEAAPAAASSAPLLTVEVAGSGTVVGQAAGIACPGACTARVTAGADVELVARPASGWAFDSWGGACSSTTPTCTVRLHAAATVTATFRHSDVPPPPPPPPPPPAGFTPQTLAGTWNGSWQNQTFGTSGSAKYVVAVTSADSFTFTATLGGNAFGCSAPPPLSGEVTPGTGTNHWDANGFAIQTAAGDGGGVSIAYDFRSNVFTGSGTSGCNPAITWTITGSFTGNTFSGKVAISLPGGISATSVINLTRA